MTTTTTGAIEGEREVAAVATAKAAPKPRRTGLIVAAVGALVAAGGAGYYVSQRGLESTDDAQVDADVVSVPTRASGVVQKVLFVENQVVKTGDVLAELDPEPAKAKLAQAEANLEAARTVAESADADERVAETNVRSNKTAAVASLHGAESSASASKDQIAEGDASVASANARLQQAKNDRDRAKALVQSGSIAQAEVDRTELAYDGAIAALNQARARRSSLEASTSQAWSKVEEANAHVRQVADIDTLIAQAHAKARTAHAQVAVAQATRDLAALELSYTKILAPQDGLASKKTIGVGQMVQPGQGIAQLVPTAQVWITGNFKETQVARMRAGQPAHASIDAFPGVKVRGEVESFSAATGARFSLLPPDNASGNYTKVVQRVPVRVKLVDVPAGIVLRPGMSVDVTVDTNR
jgi:membrane fusion protein, multidrug efflux system